MESSASSEAGSDYFDGSDASDDEGSGSDFGSDDSEGWYRMPELPGVGHPADKVGSHTADDWDELERKAAKGRVYRRFIHQRLDI